MTRSDSDEGRGSGEPPRRPPFGPRMGRTLPRWRPLGCGLSSLSLAVDCRPVPRWRREVEPLLPISLQPDVPDDEDVLDDPNWARRQLRLRCGGLLDLETTYEADEGWRIRVADWILIEVGDAVSSAIPGRVYLTVREPLLRMADVGDALRLASSYVADLGLTPIRGRITYVELAAEFDVIGGRPDDGDASVLGLLPTRQSTERYSAWQTATRFSINYADGCDALRASVRVDSPSPNERSLGGPPLRDCVPHDRVRDVRRITCGAPIADDAGARGPARADEIVWAAEWVNRRAAALWRRTIDRGLAAGRNLRDVDQERVARAWRRQVIDAFDRFVPGPSPPAGDA